MEKERQIAAFAIYVYAGIFNAEGKILLIKDEWCLPGGPIDDQFRSPRDERLFADVLSKTVFKQTGLNVYVQPMPAMYPAVFNEGTGVAFGIIVGKTDQNPSIEKTRFVDVGKVIGLTDYMTYRLCLRMFASRDCPNPEYRKQAGEILKTLHK